MNPFAYIFQIIIHSTHPPSTPPKAGLLKKKKTPYMVILLPHRQLAFLGTLFKEDPPQGFYIALVFLPKTPRPSIPRRRTSHTLGEYCPTSAASSFLGLPGLLCICAAPDLFGFCGPGHMPRPLVSGAPGTHCCLLGKGTLRTGQFGDPQDTTPVLSSLPWVTVSLQDSSFCLGM